MPRLVPVSPASPNSKRTIEFDTERLEIVKRHLGRATCHKNSAGRVTDHVECRGSWPDDDYSRAFLFRR